MSEAESCIKTNNDERPLDATPLSDLVARLGQLEASQNQVMKLQARVIELEATHGHVAQLEARVATLEARVKSFEKDLLDVEDRGVVVPGTTISPTLYAARNGHTAVLEERLGRGADPNQDDGHGGTCLMASACYGKPECARLLIEAGADATCAYTGVTDGMLDMLALVFQDRPEDRYRPGDYILTANLLEESGAPVNEMQDNGRDHGMTALDLLCSMNAEECTQHGRERRGLIAVLERTYWREHGHNPFLRASPEAAAWLLLKGAANNDTDHIDITKVRSIKPALRQSVLDQLLLYQGMRETLVPILLAMKQANSVSAFGILLGHESSILPAIAAFAGATGWTRQTIQEAIAALEEIIEHFQTDDSFQDDDEMDGGDY